MCDPFSFTKLRDGEKLGTRMICLIYAGIYLTKYTDTQKIRLISK